MAATLPLPVLISTAAGVEPQAVVLAYFLATGFLVQTILEAALARRR